MTTKTSGVQETDEHEIVEAWLDQYAWEISALESKARALRRERTKTAYNRTQSDPASVTGIMLHSDLEAVDIKIRINNERLMETTELRSAAQITLAKLDRTDYYNRVKKDDMKADSGSSAGPSGGVAVALLLFLSAAGLACGLDEQGEQWHETTATGETGQPGGSTSEPGSTSTGPATTQTGTTSETGGSTSESTTTSATGSDSTSSSSTETSSNSDSGDDPECVANCRGSCVSSCVGSCISASGHPDVCAVKCATGCAYECEYESDAALPCEGGCNADCVTECANPGCSQGTPPQQNACWIECGDACGSVCEDACEPAW